MKSGRVTKQNSATNSLKAKRCCFLNELHLQTRQMFDMKHKTLENVTIFKGFMQLIEFKSAVEALITLA